MKRPLYLSICLMATSPLWAQGTIVSPPGFETIEGNAYAYLLGGYASGHFQFGDGELRGTKRTFTQVSFWLDHQNHTSDTAMGRKWTQVSLSMSETDWTKFTNTFTANQLTTPVEVFNGAVAWPSVLGTPLTKPTAFGGKYTFPFKNPWNYSGVLDLLMDCYFRGGTMDNSAVWSGSTAYNYDLDSVNIAVTYQSPTPFYPASGPNPPCRDSAISLGANAQTYASLLVHGITDPKVSFRDKAEFQLFSFYTAPSSRLMTAIAFVGSGVGVNVGARCNLLYPNLNSPWIAKAWTTDANSYSGLYSALVPWTPSMANLQIWVQSAWDDSVTRSFSLTKAMEVTMPADKPRPPRQVEIYNYDVTAGTGNGPNFDKWAANMIKLYNFN
jgi:hypothetical protein